MKKITNRKSVILMSSGVLIIVVSQIFSHFVKLPDLTKCLFIGIGIGMSLLAYRELLNTIKFKSKLKIWKYYFESERR